MNKYDIVATVGTYKNNQGETKNKYKNVGAVMEKDGRMFMLLDRTFNIAGLPNPDNKESAILGMYPPKDKDSDYNQGLQQPSNDLDDVINF